MYTLLKTKRVAELEAKEQKLETKVKALENYLGIKFYHGKVKAPHYRRYNR